MKNEMLFKIAAGQKAKLDENMQEAFERIVLAGMEFMYKDESTSAMAMSEIEQAEDKPAAIGEGVAAVMVMLNQKSKESMPWEAGVMAGYALVCDALDFAEQKGIIKVDEAVTDTAMQAYGQKLLNLMNISNEKVDELTGGKLQAESGQAEAAPEQPIQAPAGGLLSAPQSPQEMPQ